MTEGLKDNRHRARTAGILLYVLVVIYSAIGLVFRPGLPFFDVAITLIVCVALVVATRQLLPLMSSPTTSPPPT